MAKSLRGPTRTLPVRLAESENKTELLKKRMEVAQAKLEIKRLRSKLFGR
jgi:hypothetical protein